MAIIKSPIFKDITESEISEMTTAGFLRARKFHKNSFIYHNKYSPDRSLLLLTIVIPGCVHASPVRRTSASRSLVLYQE